MPTYLLLSVATRRHCTRGVPDMTQVEITRFLIAMEEGWLSEAGVIEGFQSLIDDGAFYHLSLAYQQFGEELIAQGYCSAPKIVDITQRRALHYTRQEVTMDEVYEEFCQATFELLELEENLLQGCGTKGCQLCSAIRRTREALEEVNK